ncbi:MAG TPA: hypothetical protein VNT20_18285 [Flavisolibacter sp.]|jgi:hypothetical protein|nr:hypothetical protein [Flavisolibacter sp.]
MPRFVNGQLKTRTYDEIGVTCRRLAIMLDEREIEFKQLGEYIQKSFDELYNDYQCGYIDQAVYREKLNQYRGYFENTSEANRLPEINSKKILAEMKQHGIVLQKK